MYIFKHNLHSKFLQIGRLLKTKDAKKNTKLIRRRDIIDNVRTKTVLVKGIKPGSDESYK